MKKTLLHSAAAFVLLSAPGIARAAVADGWMNVFVSQKSISGGTQYDYVVQNKSEIAITAIEIGRSNGCIGDPAMDPATLSDKSTFKAPEGWSSSIRSGENGSVFVRFEGKSTDPRISGFSLLGNNPLLASGFVCIYRADAKVWQYRASLLIDNQAPRLNLTLSPASLQSDTLFHEINATVSGSDDVDTAPQVKLLSIKSSRSDFDFSKEVKDAGIGSDDRKFQILADKVGDFIAEYEISDAAGNRAFSTATVSIVAGADKLAPVLTVALSPNNIIATNKLESVTATITIKDNQDKAPTVKLISITSDAKDFVYATDVKNAVLNSDDRSFQLMAERSNSIDRVYRITYEAKDSAGNKSSVVSSVTIKADTRSALEKLVDAVVSLLLKLLALFR
jgi:hypothetical protein